MTNSQKNKLIQGFMGWELKFITDYDLDGWYFVNKHTSKTISGMHNVSELPYSTDWNWLMEALKKFDNLNDENQVGFTFNEYQIYSNHCDQIDYAVTLYNIDDAVNALCEGIEWYNSTLN